LCAGDDRNIENVEQGSPGKGATIAHGKGRADNTWGKREGEGNVQNKRRKKEKTQ